MTGRTGNRRYMATCPCGKRGWLHRKDAKREAKSLIPEPGRGHLDAYRCKITDSGLFHIGHLPPAVVQGKLDRSNVVARPRPHPGAPLT